MIKTLKGHENCRGRPPTKGACREGPEWIAGFETQKAFFETQEACMVLDAFTALAVKRRWDGKRLLKRPRDNIIHTDPGYSTAAQPNRPAKLLLLPDTGFLYPQRRFPPWKPWQIHARDWISHTCTGEANRIPGRHNHTCRTPQTTTAAKKPHRWAVPGNEQNKTRRSSNSTHAPCFDITYQSQNLFRRQKQTQEKPDNHSNAKPYKPNP